MARIPYNYPGKCPPEPCPPKDPCAPEFGVGAPSGEIEGNAYFDLSTTPAQEYVRTDNGWVAVGTPQTTVDQAIDAALLAKNPVVDINYDPVEETLTVVYCDTTTKDIELPDLMALPLAP